MQMIFTEVGRVTNVQNTAITAGHVSWTCHMCCKRKMAEQMEGRWYILFKLAFPSDSFHIYLHCRGLVSSNTEMESFSNAQVVIKGSTYKALQVSSSYKKTIVMKQREKINLVQRSDSCPWIHVKLHEIGYGIFYFGPIQEYNENHPIFLLYNALISH